MKKVLGISFGRRMMNCDIMVKQALLSCQQRGHEIRFIRACDLNIHHCTGCCNCVTGLVTGQGRGTCILNDDFNIIDEALMESDAVIFGCPTYVLAPTGLFKTVSDRIGPSHDISFRKVATEEGLTAGKPIEKLPDQRSLKPRVAAFFSVGGAITQNWLSFMLPIMYGIPMSMGMDVVDTYEYSGGMAYSHVVGNEAVMKRMELMGLNVAEALETNDPDERIKWRGENKGACPICHCDLLKLSGDKTFIECPVCGIRGSFLIKDGRLETLFSKSEQARSRLYYAGKLEHSIEIKTRTAPSGKTRDLKTRLEKYNW